jgi:hypothetical protein
VSVLARHDIEVLIPLTQPLKDAFERAKATVRGRK